MNKEDLKGMGNNPDFISGIYNYCDRWCEHCPFSSRFFLFATQEREFPEDESHDINNKESWDQIADIFKITFELLDDIAKKKGLDLKDMDTDDIQKEEIEKTDEMKKHPVAKVSLKYITDVNNWFEQSETLFALKDDEPNKIQDLGIAEEGLSNISIDIQDYVEIIRWYQMQIHVKIKRALRGQMNG